MLSYRRLAFRRLNLSVDYKLILPGDRELKIRCEDFARKNMKYIAKIASFPRQKILNRNANRKELLEVCHMCGMINGEHWHDDECPSPIGSNFSDSTFVKDEDLTQFSYSLFQLMGGEL